MLIRKERILSFDKSQSRTCGHTNECALSRVLRRLCFAVSGCCCFCCCCRVQNERRPRFTTYEQGKEKREVIRTIEEWKDDSDDLLPLLCCYFPLLAVAEFRAWNWCSSRGREKDCWVRCWRDMDKSCAWFHRASGIEWNMCMICRGNVLVRFAVSFRAQVAINVN